MFLRHLEHQFCTLIFDAERGKGIGGDRLPGPPVQILLIDAMVQVHEGVRLVGEHPPCSLLFQDDGQVIAIVKPEWGEHTESVDTFSRQPDLL